MALLEDVVVADRGNREEVGDLRIRGSPSLELHRECDDGGRTSNGGNYPHYDGRRVRS